MSILQERLVGGGGGGRSGRVATEKRMTVIKRKRKEK